jgi:hypothetical protein
LHKVLKETNSPYVVERRVRWVSLDQDREDVEWDWCGCRFAVKQAKFLKELPAVLVLTESKCASCPIPGYPYPQHILTCPKIFHFKTHCDLVLEELHVGTGYDKVTNVDKHKAGLLGGRVLKETGIHYCGQEINGLKPFGFPTKVVRTQRSG